ncbi:TPA: hypothetical protein ACLANX_000115 [Neisseria meningitidis]
MLPIDGSNPAPVSNTGDVDGQDAPDEKTADTVSIIGVATLCSAAIIRSITCPIPIF